MRKFLNFLSKLVIGKRKIFLVGILLAAVCLCAVFFIWKPGSSKTAFAEQRTTKVIHGDLSVSISGSGAIESSNSTQISSTVSTTVKKVHFKDGDQVKAGDILFELDDSDAVDNVDKIQSSIEEAQNTKNDTVESIDSLLVKAPFSGCISNLSLKTGDTVQKSSAILTITDQTSLKVVVPFSTSGISSMKVGQKANLNIPSLMQSVSGTISYISTAGYTTTSGGELYDVEIVVKNPGSLSEGMKASAEIATSKGTETSVEEGLLEYSDKKTLKCDAGGTVKTTQIRNNQFVNAGDILVEVENDDLDDTNKSNDNKIKDLISQKEKAQKKLLDYVIKAPYDGIISDLTINAGESVSPGTQLCNLIDTQHLQFDISIDELDIAKIEVGQKVNITLDALAETETTPLTGKVSKIPIQGTSTNGVTTYPVTILIDSVSDKLKSGMNANAEIVVSSKEDTLMVPIEAVQTVGTRKMVFVKGDGSQQTQEFDGPPQMPQGDQQGQVLAQQGNQSQDKQGNSTKNQSGNEKSSQSSNSQNSKTKKNLQGNSYYSGAVLKEVEVGINNDEYIEIVSGLNEGDVVVLPQQTASTSQTVNQNAAAGMGGMGGIGSMGGMSGPGGMGGPPNGGGNSGNSKSSSGGSSRQSK